jgi:hypothetical protein
LNSIERNCLNLENWFGSLFIAKKRKQILSRISKLGRKQKCEKAEISSEDEMDDDDVRETASQPKTSSEMDFCQDESQMDCDEPQITHEFSRLKRQADILSSDEEDDLAFAIENSGRKSFESNDEDAVQEIAIAKPKLSHRKQFPAFFESNSENDSFNF